MPRNRRLRLPFVRHPRDASHEFDDASYDGGVSGGAYTRHIVLFVIAAIVFAAVLRWLL
ncbi:hypothetical protein [Luteibacter aegosomatissinici]|uniref:hypothetical protein n=1 Tax=Luteibacter aegosomatissinici TaxID=2911539 RepID=UPI001FF9C298|nr:hypothetical protein [Luteibacter aegosomatissinici]UPG95219.1 hypothetical protein L2Y97_03660 [Luteibacter aegosomatissinici]